MTFDPANDIPDLSGKVILVTGGTAGLGRETVRVLCQHGNPHIIFTGRNAKTATETIDLAKKTNSGAKVTFVQCDLADLTSSAEAGRRIARETKRLDWVFCNAGVMAIPAALSKDGWEIQFATNHLGHAMLLKELLPVLERTAASQTKPQSGGVRVVFNTSLGFKIASDIDFPNLNTKQESMILGAFKRYGASKLANILYPAELARRYPSITFVSIHPGVIKSGLVTGLDTFNRLFTEATTYFSQVSMEEGVKNQLWAASTPEIVNGEYYEPVGKPGAHTKASKDELLAGKLYDWTQDVISKY